MKKLITTALLFAGLTMGAQNQIRDRYLVNDSTIEDGIRYIAKYDGVFVDIDSRKDTIAVYPFICLYKSGFYIEAIWVSFINKFEKVKKVKLVFEKGTVNLSVCKTVNQTRFDNKYLMAPSTKTNSNVFDSSIFQIIINGKIYVPLFEDDIYFMYMLNPFTDLKTNWYK